MQTNSLTPSKMFAQRMSFLGYFVCAAMILGGCGGSGDTETPALQGSGPTPSSGITVLWDPPVNSDGTAASNLAGYNAYYATTSPITVDNSQILEVEWDTTSVALTDFPAGTYYVAVSAVYASGNESDLSAEIEVAVQ